MLLELRSWNFGGGRKARPLPFKARSHTATRKDVESTHRTREGTSRQSCVNGFLSGFICKRGGEEREEDGLKMKK